MPDEQGKAAVCPIFRRGDRLLVELPFGFGDVVVEGGRIEGGRLWLYGVCGAMGIRFTAEAVVCRLARHQMVSWRDVF